MTTTSLALGQHATFTLGAVDGGSVPRSASFTAALPDATIAALVLQGANIIVLAVAPGTVTLTITGTALSGASIPASTLQFTITATPPPPDAVAFTETTPVVAGNDITTPGSGTASVSGSL